MAWKGKWIAAVGFLHFVAGFFIYLEQWKSIAANGFFGSIKDFELSAAAYWFMVLGPFLVAFGLLVDQIEGSKLHVSKRVSAVALIGTIVALALMPANGLWLILPPVIALNLRK